MIRDLKTLWGNPRFRLFMSSRFISNVGNGLMPIALAFGVLSLKGADATDLSYVTTSQMLPIVLFLLIGGVMADRFGRAHLVGGTDIIGSFVVGTMGILFMTHHASVLLLCIAGVVYGTLNALWYPAFSGMMPEIVDEPHLQSANSIVGFAANIGFTLGTASAGIIVGTVGAGWAILGNGISFLLAGLLVWQLRLPGEGIRQTDRQTERESMLHQLREGWHGFSTRSWLVVIVASGAVYNMCFEGFLGVLAPLQMKLEYSGASDMSWMMSGWGLGGIIGVLVALRIRPKRPLVAAVALTPVIGLWMLATGLKFPLPALVILAVGSGIALDTFYVLWLTIMQREIPEDIRSRVGAYDAFGSSLFAPLGLFLAGPIATWAGASGTLIVVGIIVAVAWISTLLSRGVRSVSA